MKRVEIMITQAIEVDFISYYEKACKEMEIKCKYTKVDDVMGQGNTNPKMGIPVWPQLNVMFIIYCEENLVEKITEIIKRLHKEYVGEGVAAFVSDAQALV